jgi:hypothetical protein
MDEHILEPTARDTDRYRKFVHAWVDAASIPADRASGARPWRRDSPARNFMREGD